jgi:hypothetical protein
VGAGELGVGSSTSTAATSSASVADSRPATSQPTKGGPSYSEALKLRDEVAWLRTKLAQAEAIIEVQGKVHALLEEISKSAASDEVLPRSWTGPWTSSPPSSDDDRPAK